MTIARDPSLRGLDGCGCCEGGGDLATLRVDNRPGLSAIAYRVGTHSRFKRSMLARLSSEDLPALAALTSRTDDDLSIALLDGWAAIADVIAFYQERIANEHYLRTATERRSLAELAGLIGYVPRPGVAASTFLAFTIEDPGVPDPVPVPHGTRVQSIPGPGEKPQTFETVEPITGRPEWNEMRPLLWRKHPDIADDTKVVTLRGASAPVKRGDHVLLVWGTGRGMRRVIEATADLQGDTLRLELAENPPQPAPFALVRQQAAVWIRTPHKLTGEIARARVQSVEWKQADLGAYAATQGWSLRKLAVNLDLQTLVLRRAITPQTGVFAFRTRASIFGHNAPKHSTLDPAKFGDSWEGKTLAQDEGGPQAQIDLDSTYPGIVPGSWLVLESQGRRDVHKVTASSETGRADYSLSGKVSRIELDASTGFSSHQIRKTTVHAESERMPLAELPVTEVVEKDRLVLDRAQLDLQAGRPVVVSGRRVDLGGVFDSEVVEVADIVLNNGYTELVFATSLAHRYERASVTVNANVALASHGESREQVLGSGDSGTPFQRFPLPEAPLTHEPARTDTGAASTLEVRVNGLLWTEVDFLYGRGPEEHVYITRDDDEGRTFVIFGDGRTAARLPTGRENVTARYRKGMGAEGLVKEGQLSLPMTRPLGVKAVVNPVPAGDAADRDGPEDLRESAPLPVRTLGRIVSLRDYEDFARAFTGVGKALATWTWNGHGRGVFVTVAGPDGEIVDAAGRTHRNLTAAMLAAGDPTVPMRVATYRPATFRTGGTVRVDPAHEPAAVLSVVEAALRARFAFRARRFGQPVAKSEVIAVIQGVPGVVAVDLDLLQRVDATAQELAGEPVRDTLLADVPRAGTDVTVGAELLLLDAQPLGLVGAAG